MPALVGGKLTTIIEATIELTFQHRRRLRRDRNFLTARSMTTPPRPPQSLPMAV